MNLCNLGTPPKASYCAVQYIILYEPPKADGTALWVLACFHKIRRASERRMCVNDRCARDALKVVRSKRHPPRTYATSLRTFSETRFVSGHPSKGHPTVESTGRYGKKHPEYDRKQLPEEEHYLHNKKSRTISEWLDLCGIDLYENEVRWLHDKLDELPDL
jgi:hypothetical protein